MGQLRFFVLTAAGELLYPIKRWSLLFPSALNHTHTIRTDMKPHLPTALRRALLAALAVAALAPAAWAETFTLTQDTSYKCGEGDWSLGAAFKSEITEVSYTFTSNPENKYSLSFSGGTDGVFCDYSGSGSFDYLTFTQLNGLSFSGNEAPSPAGVIRSSLRTITLTDVLTGGDKINSSGASVEDSYANGGLELAEDSAATLYLRGGSIDKEVTLGETSQLKAEGENNNITALTVDEGASLTVSSYEQEGKPTVAGELTIADELVLNGTATVAEGATITLGSSTTLASAISNDGTVALAGEITLNGFTKETVYTYSAGSNSGYRTTSEGYAVITGTGTTTGTATKEGYGEGSEYKQRNKQFCIKK